VLAAAVAEEAEALAGAILRPADTAIVGGADTEAVYGKAAAADVAGDLAEGIELRFAVCGNAEHADATGVRWDDEVDAAGAGHTVSLSQTGVGTMRFTKMHGLGNDYVYVDAVNAPPPADPAAVAVAVADRHFGIGSDGLILVCRSDVADARMRMFNADGSESEMCGNGLRCVAKFVYDRGIAKKPRLELETGRGVLTVEVEVRNERVERVRVNMGEPILESARIPTTLAGDPPIDVVVNAGSRDFAVTAVSMGNPHAVAYVGDEFFTPSPDLVAQFGPLLEHHAAFPRRVNAHFVKVHSSSEITMRTWERGSGITLACGTGACAVCVAGVLTGRTSRRLRAHLPGGDLELDWSEADNCVYMTGPATEVFTGDWPGHP
jgi:diaminopimelate epimerase